MLKIYLDNCCYNRPFDEHGRSLVMLETEAKLFIQGKIKEGLYSLVWSFILDSENDENPSDTRNGSEIYGKIGPLMRFTNLPRNARRRGRYRHGPKLNWEVLDEGCDGA